MGRILFPGYFPVGNCIKSSEQQPFGPTTYHNTPATINQLLESYWRVRRWRISNSFLGTSYEFYNWSDQGDPPNTEEKLVCGALSEFDPGNSYIGANIGNSSVGSFGSIFNSFLAIVGFTPAIYDVNNPASFYMGLYIDLAYSTDNPYTAYQGISFSVEGVPSEAFSIPMHLSNSTINIPMFYYPSEGYLPASHIEIRAIQWWAYDGIYDENTGLVAD